VSIEKLVDTERRLADVTNRVQTLESSLGNTQQLAVAGAIEAYQGVVPPAIADAVAPVQADADAAGTLAAQALAAAVDAKANPTLTSAKINAVGGDTVARAAAADAKANPSLSQGNVSAASAAGVGFIDPVARAMAIQPVGLAPGQDAAAAIEAAWAIARLTGADVLLPPYTIKLSRPIRVNRLRGIPGLSKIDVSDCVMGTFPLSQFCIVNEHFNQAYNSATADRCSYVGFDVFTTPTKAQSLIGVANVSFIDVDQVTLQANRNINGTTGKPFIVDGLLDLYACVRGGFIRRSNFNQLTGAYKTTRVDGGGGGCLWIRNYALDGTAVGSVTENILVTDNDFRHYTTDEAIAIYGVQGRTHHNRVIGNRITSLEAADLGLPLSESIFRAGLATCFPLNNGTGALKGDTAATYNNEIADNFIVDRSPLYNTIRIGNSPDAAQRCENNVSRNNKIDYYFSTDATYGPLAAWVTAGSVGTSPASSNIPVRCIEGTAGVAFQGAISGNRSESDEVVVRSGATISAGFSGWQMVFNGSTRGSLTCGARTCGAVDGGSWETSLQGFVDCSLVTVKSIRISAASNNTHAHFVVNSTTPGTFAFNGARVTNGGAVAYISPGASASTIVSVQGCSGTIGAYPALNNTVVGAVIKANGNQISGASAATAGTGTFKRANNTWGAIDD
jgi:hypothetical protein